MEMSIFIVLFLIGMGMFAIEFIDEILGNSRRSKNSDIVAWSSTSLITPVVLLLTYVLVVMTFSGSSSGADFAGVLAGGIPWIGNLTSFWPVLLEGSLFGAAVMFLHCVFAVLVTDSIARLIPLSRRPLTRLFAGVVLSGITLALLSYIRGNIGWYICVGILMSLVCITGTLSTATFLVDAMGIANPNSLASRFAQSQIGRKCRIALFKGILYLLGMLWLERQLSNGNMDSVTGPALSAIKEALSALAPVVVMLLGYGLLFSSARRKS